MTDPTPIGHVDDIAVRNRIIQAIRAEIADMDPDGDLADLPEPGPGLAGNAVWRAWAEVGGMLRALAAAESVAADSGPELDVGLRGRIAEVALAVTPVAEEHYQALEAENKQLRARLAELEQEHQEYIRASLELYAMAEEARGSACRRVYEERERREMIEYTLEHAEIRLGEVVITCRGEQWECRGSEGVEEYPDLGAVLARARRVVWGDS